MKEKHGLSYTLVKSDAGDLSYILVTGNLPDQLIKELQTASRWAFAKALGE